MSEAEPTKPNQAFKSVREYLRRKGTSDLLHERHTIECDGAAIGTLNRLRIEVGSWEGAMRGVTSQVKVDPGVNYSPRTIGGQAVGDYLRITVDTPNSQLHYYSLRGHVRNLYCPGISLNYETHGGRNSILSTDGGAIAEQVPVWMDSDLSAGIIARVFAGSNRDPEIIDPIAFFLLFYAPFSSVYPLDLRS
jgi:hypothetical protein